MCGFDGALGRYPVGIEAAHVRWHSQEGPDEIPNALALCALHHALFDLGVVGITEDRRISVSGLYVARNEAGRAVDELAGKPLLIPRPRQPKVDVIYIAWHSRQAPRGTKLRTQTLEETPARSPARSPVSPRRAFRSRAPPLARVGCEPLLRSYRSARYSCSSATQRGTGPPRSSRALPPCARTTSRCWPAFRSSARRRQGAARRPPAGQMQGV